MTSHALVRRSMCSCEQGRRKHICNLMLVAIDESNQVGLTQGNCSRAMFLQHLRSSHRSNRMIRLALL